MLELKIILMIIRMIRTIYTDLSNALEYDSSLLTPYSTLKFYLDNVFQIFDLKNYMFCILRPIGH